MKYWVKGSKDVNETRKILYAFSVLGYNVEWQLVWLSNSSENEIFYTWDFDNEVHSVVCCEIQKANREYEMLKRLIELDPEFVELKPDEIVTDPKFAVNDVIYTLERTSNRAMVTSLDTQKQCYTVKTYNNLELTIKFSDQDKWNKVIYPKFKEDTVICERGGIMPLYILRVDNLNQFYVVNTDNDGDYICQIPFSEEDRFEEKQY